MIFQRKEDRDAEDAIMAKCAFAWNCTIRRFGGLCPVDWYALREEGNRPVPLSGVLECKDRKHPFRQFPTVWISVRKWMNLTNNAPGLACDPIFVAGFTGGEIWWVNVWTVDATKNRMGGRRMMRTEYDYEPVIDVPLAQWKSITKEPF